VPQADDAAETQASVPTLESAEVGATSAVSAAGEAVVKSSDKSLETSMDLQVGKKEEEDQCTESAHKKNAKQQTNGLDATVTKPVVDGFEERRVVQGDKIAYTYREFKGYFGPAKVDEKWNRAAPVNEAYNPAVSTNSRRVQKKPSRRQR